MCCDDDDGDVLDIAVVHEVILRGTKCMTKLEVGDLVQRPTEWDARSRYRDESVDSDGSRRCPWMVVTSG